MDFWPGLLGFFRSSMSRAMLLGTPSIWSYRVRGGLVCVVHSVMLVILLAFLRYSVFYGWTKGSFLLRKCSSRRLIIREPACRADLFISVSGVGSLVSVHAAPVSAFFHNPVITRAAVQRHILIGALSSSLICAQLKISTPYVMVGTTVALTTRDASSGLSFLMSGMTLYSLVEPAAASWNMCVRGLRLLVSNIPTNPCFSLLRIWNSPSVTRAVLLFGAMFLQGN